MRSRFRKFIVLVLSSVVLSVPLEGALVETASAQDAPAAKAAPAPSAEACGWYAIAACSASSDEANGFADKNKIGQVIDTSGPQYPNFRPGFFCVVSGPTDMNAALATVVRWQNSGVSPDAYVKHSC